MLEIRYNLNNPNCLINYKYFVFNGGEPSVTIIDTQYLHEIYGYSKHIYCKIQKFEDVGLLMVVVDAMRRINPSVKLRLYLPYFPGARQDRVANSGEALTVKVYADIINSLNFESVEICDPHSDVTTALLNNVKLYPIENIIEKVINKSKPDIIISPDAGATKRINAYLGKIKCELPVIQGIKTRDTKTGKLSNFGVVVDSKDQLLNKKCLLIDDLCENGGTFIGLAKVLKEYDTDLRLYITHGIFPKGQKNINELFKYFGAIYCTDSFISETSQMPGYTKYPLYSFKSNEPNN